MTDETRVLRRVTGHHDLRLDGISDLLHRARGAAVLDVGCNRGMAGYEFACNGARLVHGCDLYEKGIETAKEVFADIRNCESKFSVVDLAKAGGLAGFTQAQRYDVVLLLAITHKLRRQMKSFDFNVLMISLANSCNRYIGWRGYDEEVSELDGLFGGPVGFKRIQYSTITESVCPAAIWRRDR